MAELRTYELTMDGKPLSPVSATSRSAARYAAFAGADWFPDSFMDFCRGIDSIRVVSPPRPAVYDYIRRRYGLSVRVGQHVETPKGAGTVACPAGDSAHVYVVLDGETHPQPWHPGDVLPASEGEGGDA